MPTTGLVSDNELSRVLIVCPSRQPLESVFSMATELPAKVTHVKTCQAARGNLAVEQEPDIVITATTLPDGNWECILRAMVDNDADGSLVVIAPAANSVSLKAELEARGVVGLFSDLPEVDARALLSAAWCEGRANRLTRRLVHQQKAAASS